MSHNAFPLAVSSGEVMWSMRLDLKLSGNKHGAAPCFCSIGGIQQQCLDYQYDLFVCIDLRPLLNYPGIISDRASWHWQKAQPLWLWGATADLMVGGWRDGAMGPIIPASVVSEATDLLPPGWQGPSRSIALMRRSRGSPSEVNHWVRTVALMEPFQHIHLI